MFTVIVWTLFAFPVNTGALSCFQCTNLTTPIACNIKTACLSDEICYSEILNDTTTRAVFNLGCQKTSICQQIDTDVIIGRKRQTPGASCTKCCTSDDCNLSLCATTVIPPYFSTNSDVHVRLTHSAALFQGTVEVFHNNTWNNVCSDGWTQNEAKVVCSMLGFQSNGFFHVDTDVQQSNTSSRLWLNDVTCSGSEPSISQCDHVTWDETSCPGDTVAGVVCSSVTSNEEVMFMLDIDLQIFVRMNIRTQSYTVIPTVGKYSPGSFDYDSTHDRLFFSDYKYKQILSMKSDGTDLRLLKQLDLNSRPDNIAVDPFNHVLFYSDNGLNVIASVNTDGSNFTNVITSALNNPRAVTLDPRSKTIYWADRGIQPKIESAHYDGSSRTTLTNINVTFPNYLAIDFDANRLYFVDGGQGTIESMDLQGNDRRVILRDTSVHFYSLDLFGDDLYFTARDISAPMKIKKDGSNFSYIRLPDFRALSEVKVHKYDVNGTALDPLQLFVRLSGRGDSSSSVVEIYVNGQWGTLCTDTWDDRHARVICHMLGFDRYRAVATNATYLGDGLLSLDKANCQGSESHISDCDLSLGDWGWHNCSRSEMPAVYCEPPNIYFDYRFDNFVVFCDVAAGDLIRMDLNTFSYTRIHGGFSPNIVALTFDPYEQLYYYSDVYTEFNMSVIKTSNERGNSILTLSNTPSGSMIMGMAFDYKRNILFYTDAGHKRLVTVFPDGSDMKILASDIDEAKSLALDRSEEVVYWTAGGVAPKIEKVSYDGSNRRTIASTGLNNPVGIAVDSKGSFFRYITIADSW